MSQVFIDMDGVLADFDGYAEGIFNMPPHQAEQILGTSMFWKTLHADPDFYANLPPMHDAYELSNGVLKYCESPIILTGVPMGDWARPQKEAWRDKHFPSVPMITCYSKNKRDHAKPGDILIDDMLKYRHLWEEMGGTFILHTSAKDSLRQLEDMFR